MKVLQTNNTFLGTAYNTLFTTFNNVYGSGTEGGVTSTSTPFNSALSGVNMVGKGNVSTAPRAFLNYIVFDKEMNFEKAGFQQISTAAMGVGINETISRNDIIAEEDGYILAYLSNENQETVDVHFDDFTVVHAKTNIVSTQDYYPFGGTFNNYRRSYSTAQNYTYNGKELQPETGWLDYGARMYDPWGSRFLQIDPSADNYLEWTPYNYVGNNPINVIDPDGKDWYEINGKIRWRNREGDYTNKKGKEFKSLGKNVLVVTHNRDKDGNEEVNSATFSLYLESDKSGATATLKGNTVPSDTEEYGTLAEGIYPAKFQARAGHPGENALIINEGKELPTVNGNPSKENSDKLTGVFFHRGNPYQASLLDSNGDPVWSHGCLLGGCGPGSLDKFNTFMGHATDFNGNLYLRAKPEIKTKTRATTKTHQWTRVNGKLTLVPKKTK